MCNSTHAIGLRRVIYKVFPVYKALCCSSSHFELRGIHTRHFSYLKLCIAHFSTFELRKEVYNAFFVYKASPAKEIEQIWKREMRVVERFQKSYAFESLTLSVFTSHCFRNNASRHFYSVFLAPLSFVFQVPFFISSISCDTLRSNPRMVYLL